MPINHELLPYGQSEASSVYVPASTWTVFCKAVHELTFCVVEPLNRYVPGDGSVTTTPGSVPNVLGRPVTRGYRFANSYPPLKTGVIWFHPIVRGVAGFQLGADVAVLQGGRGLAGEDFEAQADGICRDCRTFAGDELASQ